MAFDPCPHLRQMERIRVGKILFPDEKNITVLNAKVCSMIGVLPIQLNSVYATVDPYLDLLRLVVITAGEYLRDARGWDKEPDLEKLYRETAAELGIPEQTPKPVGEGVNQFPSPEKTGPFGECPMCHEKGLVVRSLCPSCRERVELKFESEMKCVKCDFHEYSHLYSNALRTTYGIPIPEGMKHEMGLMKDNKEK
jgi:hypothetical protein